MSRKTGYVRTGRRRTLDDENPVFWSRCFILVYITPQKIGVFNRGWCYAKQCVCVFYSRREFRSNAVADEQVVPSVWSDVVDR